MSATATPQKLADGKLLIDRPADHVVRLTIANPQRRNALDQAIMDGIVGALGELVAEGAARCVILTGSHGMFSAGYEIGEIGDQRFMGELERKVAHPFTAAIEALESYPYPTLAALPGHTIGGGLELALGCDLRVAADTIKLGMPPAKLGLVYSYTGLRRFIDAIGVARTRELFLLGSYIEADTALLWGLVNRVVPPTEIESVALALACELAGNAPLSQQGNKRIIANLLQAEGRLTREQEIELSDMRLASFASHDLREGISAFAEKRAPRWRGE